MKGSLYIVSTPIGNLEDITLRALRILKEVNLILCEDKRVTIKLLNKYEIKTKLISYHKFNERSQTEEVIKELKNGTNIALVSDAGTPIISDPGFELVKEVRENNIKVIAIPGPCALTSAISVSGKVKNDFLFIGFLSDEKNKRTEKLKSLKDRSESVLLYVGPHDLKKYLKEISDIYPDIEIFICRELTKIYEEFISGKIKDIIEKLKDKEVKGEVVLGLIFNQEAGLTEITDKEVLDSINKLTNKGLSLKEIAKILSNEYNLSGNKIYNLYIKNK
jgi:16S rRNA (cytidine1402-2'-O)-methyltransferase